MSRIGKCEIIMVLIGGMVCVYELIAASPPTVPKDSEYATMRALTTDVELNGIASGGILIFADAMGSGSVSIETKTGETADSVVKRLATKINEADPFHWWGDRTKVYWTPEIAGVIAMSNTLERVPPGNWIFAGTESGLSIPKPPLFLSSSFDPIRNQLTLQWVNPPQHCSYIRCSGMTLSPTASKCVIELKDLGVTRTRIDERPFDVVIFQGRTPSCAGLITVYTNAQEDCGCIPFYQGIMPNWTIWSTSLDSSDVVFEQGIKQNVPTNRLQTADRPENSPFYQIIKTRRPGVQAGIWRRFLGLKPGHTYRISARLNTFGMDAGTNDWSFSLHAAYNASPRSDFTSAHFTGTLPLPNGQSGPTSGQIASYGRGMTTHQQWARCSTGTSDSAGQRDITLPPDVTSISVWLRCSGVNLSGVGIDWLRIEDVTSNL